MEGESGYYADGICASYIYDYDNEYIPARSSQSSHKANY